MCGVQVPVSCGAYTDSLRVLKNATSVSLRIFYDATFLEAFYENGRVAFTAPADVISGTPQLVLTSTAPALHVAATKLYAVRSIWATAEAVRNAPRVYGAAVA